MWNKTIKRLISGVSITFTFCTIYKFLIKASKDRRQSKKKHTATLEQQILKNERNRLICVNRQISTEMKFQNKTIFCLRSLDVLI